MTASEALALARRGIEQFNAADWDGLRGTCEEGIVYRESGTGRTLEGIDDCIAAWAAWRVAMPDIAGEVGRGLADGPTVAVEVVWRGTHDGPLETPDGPIPATGRPVEIVATQWQQHSGGRIATIDHHLDLLALLGQIGALP